MDGAEFFNHFNQPDVNLTRLRQISHLKISRSCEIRLPLLWSEALAGKINGSIAANTGVGSVAGILKCLLVGAEVVMTTSSLLRNGVGYTKILVDDLERWLEVRGVGSLGGRRGRMNRMNIGDAAEFKQKNYIKTLQSCKQSPWTEQEKMAM